MGIVALRVFIYSLLPRPFLSAAGDTYWPWLQRQLSWLVMNARIVRSSAAVCSMGRE